MKIRACLLCLATLIALSITEGTVWAQAGNATLSTVSKTGDPSPAGVPFANFVTVASNDAGQTVFIAGGGTGLFLRSAGTVTALAVSTDAIPGMNGVLYDEFRSVAINGRGDIAFVASFLGSRSGSGVLLMSGGMVRLLVSSGDRVPGPVFASFQAFSNPILNENGDIAFTGEFSNSDTGAFLFSGGTVQPIAVGSQTAPGTNGGKFTVAAARSLTNNKIMLVQGGIEGGSAREGIFLFRDGALQAMLLSGVTIPGGINGDKFLRYSNSRLIDESGTIVFYGAGIASGGIFILSGGALQPVIVDNQPAPGTGGKMIADYFSIAANLRGDFTFNIKLANQQLVLYRYSGRALTPVIISDQNMTGSFAGRFMPAGDIFINNAGAISFVGSSSSPATTGVFTITGNTVSAVATSQTPVPGSRLRLSTDVGLNNRGAVAFNAVATGNGKSLFLSQGGSLSSMMLAGAAAPGAGDGSISDLTGSKSHRMPLSEQNELAMASTLAGTSITNGLFLASAAPLQTLALVNGAVPGVSGARYTDFSQSVINNSGAATYSCIFRQGSGDKEAIVQLKGGAATVLAASQQAAPGAGGAKFDGLEARDLWSNDSGDVAFVALLDDGREALFLYSTSNRQLTPIALGNQPAPGATGRNFESFDTVMINSQKMVVFTATLTDDAGGVFLFANGVLSPVALFGQVVPGVLDRTFVSFDGASINDGGKIIVLGRWGAFNQGVFRYVGGALLPIALTAQPVPELQGKRFTRFYGVAFNNKDEIVFSASLDGSPIPSVIIRATPIQ